jgi:hypothetical protein
MMISHVIFISLFVIHSVAFMPTAGARMIFINRATIRKRRREKEKVELTENCKNVSTHLNMKPNTCLARPVLDFRDIYNTSNFIQEKNDWIFYHKNCEFIAKKPNPFEIIIVFLCFMTLILMIAFDKNLTPLRILNAQRNSFMPFITAQKVCVMNVQLCKQGIHRNY